MLLLLLLLLLLSWLQNLEYFLCNTVRMETYKKMMSAKMASKTYFKYKLIEV